ncbi:MAG: CCA tRNA nucleotidyltransferase [Verrucomicrobiae bacterium]|nr:CCA tRNA nucleotidyltransferase [Verrucomicrobiae bacterium]
MDDKRHKAEEIVRTLRERGYAAYFAGGCVRDMLSGAAPKDYDVATSARPEQVQEVFPKTVAVGAAFGVILVLQGDQSIEVATFRSDGNYVDGRRPESVAFTTAEEDARRRDFTINGMFLDPVTGEVLDFVNGQADLRRKMLRAIGEPRQRFREDKLRMLRCVRFAVALGFEVEAECWSAVREMAGEVRSVSPERIREELTKILTGPHAGQGLQKLFESGLLEQVLPEAVAMRGCPQPAQYHPEGDVFTHTCIMLDSLEDPSPVLAWSVLFHDISKPDCLSFGEDGQPHHYGHEKKGAEVAVTVLRRLHAPNELIAGVHDAVLYHMQFKDVQRMKLSTVKRMMSRPGFEEEMALHRADCLSSHGRLDNHDYLRRLQTELPPGQIDPPPLLSGRDLMALGIEPGPGMGKILEEIRELQLESRLTSFEEARQWVLEGPRKQTHDGNTETT